MFKNLALITALIFSISAYPADYKKLFQKVTTNTKSDDSTGLDPEIIYITDTTYLPPDTIRKIDTLRSGIPARKGTHFKKTKRKLIYGETFGSLWAFSISEKKVEAEYSTNIIANQQIVFNFGKIVNDWKYYVRLSQSRFAEVSLSKTYISRNDTIYNEDSVYVKSSLLTQTSKIRNYYIYSYIGLGISNEIRFNKRNPVVSLHPSIHAGLQMPWKVPEIYRKNDKAISEKVLPSSGLILALNCGIYFKIRQNMKLALLPEYSHFVVFSNRKPFSNRNILNVHIGVFISTN